MCLINVSTDMKSSRAATARALVAEKEGTMDGMILIPDLIKKIVSWHNNCRLTWPLMYPEKEEAAAIIAAMTAYEKISLNHFSYVIMKCFLYSHVNKSTCSVCLQCNQNNCLHNSDHTCDCIHCDRSTLVDLSQLDFDC